MTTVNLASGRPKLPAAPLDATPLIALTLISAAAVGVGLAGFRRRDIG
jgi:ABC-2 type transport system permease protein